VLKNSRDYIEFVEIINNGRIRMMQQNRFNRSGIDKEKKKGRLGSLYVFSIGG
jgi:hypothetical protein